MDRTALPARIGSRILFDFSLEPSPGGRPVATNGGRGHIENLRRLRNGQANKVAKLNNTALPRVERFQFLQCFVNTEDLVSPDVGEITHIAE